MQVIPAALICAYDFVGCGCWQEAELDAPFGWKHFLSDMASIIIILQN